MQGQKTRWHQRLCQHPEDCHCLVWAESQQASLNPLLLPRAPQFQASCLHCWRETSRALGIPARGSEGWAPNLGLLPVGGALFQRAVQEEGPVSWVSKGQAHDINTAYRLSV